MGACICVVDLKAIRHAGEFIGEDRLYVIGLNGRRGTIRGNGKDQKYDAWKAPSLDAGHAHRRRPSAAGHP